MEVDNFKEPAFHRTPAAKRLDDCTAKIAPLQPGGGFLDQAIKPTQPRPSYEEWRDGLKKE